MGLRWRRNYFTVRNSCVRLRLQDILAECPYHLDSLLMMAELFRQQEEFRRSRDMIGQFFPEGQLLVLSWII